MSRTDTRIKVMNLERCSYTQSNEPNSQMSMVLRLESSCVNLAVPINGYSTCCCYMLSNVVDFILLLDIYCFLFWVGRWYLLSTRVLYWPLLVCFSFVICRVQQTCRRLQLNSNSSQSSPRQFSGWAIVPSSDWILSHSCLDVLGVRTWTISCIYF